MKNKRDSKTAMFLMEMIVVVCFFILCSTVCILVFVKADRLSRLAKDTNEASLAAESVAEIWKAEGAEGLKIRFLMAEDGEEGVIYWDRWWNPVEDEKAADYEVRIELAGMGLAGGELVETALIRVRRLRDDMELFDLNVKKICH